MVKRINKKLKESKLKEAINGVKIFADTCYIEAYEDGYETGEGDYIEEWQESLSGEYNNLQELVNELHLINDKYSNDLSNYIFMDGHLYTDVTTNMDYTEPTEDELDKFTKSEINLCVLHIYIPLEVGMKPHRMTEDEAEKYGVEVY